MAALVRACASLLALPLLLLAPLAHAQTSPGTDIVNVATCDYSDPGASTLPPGGTVRVPSNPVLTRVSSPGCFQGVPILAVSPAGTVAPGEMLTYTMTAHNDSGGPLTTVRLALPLDPGLDDPLSYTDGTAPLVAGGTVPIVGSFDPLTRSIEWSIARLEDGNVVTVQADVRVRAGLAADSVITVTGSCDADGCSAAIDSNPVSTPVIPPVLRVTKAADRPVAIPGDAVVYEITVLHEGTAPDFTAVDVVDVLPRALRYVRGSARLDGAPLSDPQIGADGRSLTFAIGPLSPGDTRVLRFAAIVTAVAEQGETVNTAHARGLSAGGAPLASPIASAVVAVVPGPFRREAYLVGQVFVDEDGDGMPAENEAGVPGVLVLMEDGRASVTDVTGRWHIDGVRPGLHVLRVDPATLPDGLTPVAADVSWGGDPDTRFVEVRASTLVVTDFPMVSRGAGRCRLDGGSAGLAVPRSSLLDDAGDPTTAAAAHLESAAGWMVSRGLSGGGTARVVCAEEDARETEAAALSRLLTRYLERRLRADGVVVERGAGRTGEANVSGRGTPADGPVSDADPFGRILRTVAPEPAILAPADGARVDRGTITVDVVFPAGATPVLEVNGRPVPAERIGASASLPSRGVAAARYVGVPLRAGRNRLSLRTASGNNGNPAVEAVVVLPDVAAALRLEVPDERWTADGTTSGELIVEAVDAAGVRAAERRVVTVLAEGAEPQTADLDPVAEGLQVRLEDGRARLRFAPLAVPGRVHVVATSERLEIERFVDVMPGAARWTVVGLAEGRLAGAAGVEGDAGQAPGLDDGVSDDGGRLAVFARGPVGTSSQLTVSVDSGRERDRDRLLQDFEPDRFYPVTGDASRRIDEAPSQGEVFARLDGPRGFAQWGDFRSGLDRTELMRYDRLLNGASGRLVAGERFALQTFAASSEQRLVREVFAADGTSGPFLLTRRPVVARSETVIVEARDRFRSDRVLSQTIKRQDLDYDLDPLAGTILFHAPIAPFDRDLNPQRIIVLYESRARDSEQLIGGGRVAFTPGERFELGASAIYEQRVGRDLGLYGLDLTWRPRPGTSVRGEYAADDAATPAAAASLQVASRIGARLGWELSYRDLDAGFANPSYLGRPELGSRRLGGSVVWQPAEHWRVRGEAYGQDDETLGLERRVAGVDAERRFERATAFGGVKSVSSDGPAVGDVSSTLVKAGVRGRLGRRWTGELSRDQVLGGDTAPGFPSRTAAAIGYRIREGLNLFLRQELESGDGPDRDRTVLGVEGRVSGRTKALASYSLDDGADGAALRATTGVETVLPLGPRSTARFSAARLDTMRGDRRADFTTLAGGWEYRAGSSLASGRYELRLGEQDTRHLFTVAGALRPRDAWTFFVRQRLFVTDPEDAREAYRAEGLLGAAYRPRARRLQFLARLDHGLANRTSTTGGGVAAGGALSEPAGSVSAPFSGGGAPGLGFTSGREAAQVDRDSVSLAFALGVRVSRRERLAAALIGRHVNGDSQIGVPATLTHLLSLHYTVQVRERWTVGASARRFVQTESETERYGAGLEAGYLVLKNLWLTAGYNFSGFDDDAFAGVSNTESGPFLSVRFKFDENTLSNWGDLRLDR